MNKRSFFGVLFGAVAAAFGIKATQTAVYRGPLNRLPPNLDWLVVGIDPAIPPDQIVFVSGRRCGKTLMLEKFKYVADAKEAERMAKQYLIRMNSAPRWYPPCNYSTESDRN